MDIREKLKSFLASNDLLSLATSDGKEVYACNLHYYADSEFNLYFVSRPDRKHSENILKHPQVSLCIYDPKYDEEMMVSGIQMKWICTQYTTNDGIEHMKAYYEKFPEKYNAEIKEILENYDFRSFYKIEPKWVRVIDGRSRDLPHEATF